MFLSQTIKAIASAQRRLNHILHSYPMHPHPLQGNLWVMTPSPVFKAKHLAGQHHYLYFTNRKNRAQASSDCTCVWWFSNDTVLAPQLLSLCLPKIPFPYLQSPYLYFTCISTLIRVLLFAQILTKSFLNAVKTHWDWGHSSLLCIYCAQTLHPGPELQLVLHNSLFCIHSVWFYITG